MKFVVLLICLFSVVIARPSVWKSIPVDDPTVNLLTEKGIEHRNKNDNSIYYEKLIAIKKAQTQALAPAKYKIEFLIGPTECLKTDPNSASCQISTNKASETCIFVFLIRRGSNDIHITRDFCSPA
ncbi:cystatin-1 [Tetranychus urticae]|uniref:Cystatin domain-containing protein n=1 Tax=Tetranychus urticae TaxID=32264 RepID=T1K831_TETUR|nr:cystatin-1 [Tetranychus urticae]